MKNETPMGKDDRWDPKKLLEQRESDDARAKCNETLVPQKQRRPNPIRRLLKAIIGTTTLIAACIGLVATVNGCSDAMAQENAWQGDSHRFYRVRIGQCAYAVYDNGRHGGIVHAGDCRNPIHKENQR